MAKYVVVVVNFVLNSYAAVQMCICIGITRSGWLWKCIWFVIGESLLVLVTSVSGSTYVSISSNVSIVFCKLTWILKQ